MSSVSYLAQLGVNSTVIQVTLTPREKILENSISQLLQIIDEHKGYWTLTGSKVTLDALIMARSAVLGLLDAVHRSEYRLEYTCAAIYQQDLKSLMKAIRAPIFRANDHEGQRIRAKVTADRRRVKNFLKEIVRELKNMCTTQIDTAAFLRFVRAPKAAIEAWCGETEATVDRFDEEEEIDNAEGITIVPTPPPPGMFN
jgi:hypothetical protein